MSVFIDITQRKMEDQLFNLALRRGLFQGYFFSRPLTAGQLTEKLDHFYRSMAIFQGSVAEKLPERRLSYEYRF